MGGGGGGGGEYSNWGKKFHREKEKLNQKPGLVPILDVISKMVIEWEKVSYHLK